MPEYGSPEVEYKPAVPPPQQQLDNSGASPSVVEHYRSQFIKEGLKLKVQQKLKEETVRESVEEETDIKPEKEVGRNHLYIKM
jgi:hypothetical protein